MQTESTHTLAVNHAPTKSVIRRHSDTRCTHGKLVGVRWFDDAASGGILTNIHIAKSQRRMLSEVNDTLQIQVLISTKRQSGPFGKPWSATR